MFWQAAGFIFIGGSIIAGLGYLLPDSVVYYGAFGFAILVISFVLARMTLWPGSKLGTALLFLLVILGMSCWACLNALELCRLISSSPECSAQQIRSLTINDFLIPALLGVLSLPLLVLNNNRRHSVNSLLWWPSKK